GISVDGRAGCFFCTEPIVAETWAVLTVVRLAANVRGCSEVLTDFQSLVHGLSEPEDMWPWAVASLFAAINLYLSQCPCINVHYCPRSRLPEVNRVAK
ncbi:hypothetical protein LINGRAHAP2_LOCUS2115, partial [Linum grandiflorum]